ncbi:hypothetical protein P170DRAFT_439309 [Aspergillus steynii IBT 23096]|uniref:Uncharacterized protein n=1 Tax=Aspergillus steynii IBT 23096 TaxID=1392250 RepID=A0A2I2FY56_9EURO|nr:uncharacterized protein P170DRAFT_439309 [Aspergillus steynii IBT 23096]PLB45563.1 hypothetical protein P170DRAFT_439309 [Aspergillus steynii IBT 23096]
MEPQPVKVILLRHAAATASYYVGIATSLPLFLVSLVFILPSVFALMYFVTADPLFPVTVPP